MANNLKNRNKIYDNADQVAAVFKNVLATDDGKQMYAILVSRFRTPDMMPSNSELLMARRIGEESVLRFIDNMIERESE